MGAGRVAAAAVGVVALAAPRIEKLDPALVLEDSVLALAFVGGFTALGAGIVWLCILVGSKQPPTPLSRARPDSGTAGAPFRHFNAIETNAPVVTELATNLPRHTLPTQWRSTAKRQRDSQSRGRALMLERVNE